jgi:hypothetical protein
MPNLKVDKYPTPHTSYSNISSPQPCKSNGFLLEVKEKIYKGLAIKGFILNIKASLLN